MLHRRLIALTIVIGLLSFCLCGCSQIRQVIGDVLGDALGDEPLPTQTAEDDPTQETTSTESSSVDVNGEHYTVTSDTADVYAGPGTNYTKIGYYLRGDSITVFEIITMSGILWGRTEKGWISMTDTVSGEIPPTQTQPAESFDSRMGITTGDFVNLRKGPGLQYDTCGNLRIHTRLQILEVDGNWGRTPQGWIFLDYVYIDGTYGKDPAIMGTIKGTDVNIRSGPGTNYTAIASTNTGDRYLFFYQVTLNGRRWGCTSNGWICMEFVILDGSQGNLQTGPTLPHGNDDIIFGTWQTASRCTYCTNSRCIVTSGYWTFHSDGTFSRMEHDAHYFYKDNGTLEYDNTQACGSQEYRGTYTYDGKTLVLTYTFIEWDETTPLPYSETCTATVHGNTLTISFNNQAYSTISYYGTLESVAGQLFTAQ